MKIKLYLHEFIGTFVLVLVGCGAGVVSGFLTNIGLAFGLILMAMIYVFGASSGAHFNPAVSFAMALSKRLSWKDFAFYSLFQVLGGIVASLVLVGFLGANTSLASNTFTLPSASGQMAYLIGTLVEIFVTFIFITVILKVSKDKNLSSVAGLIIGLTLAALIYMSGPLTNASLNPARSIGPALFSANPAALPQLFFFILGPMLGGLLAAIAQPLISNSEAA
ncbi:aquaporin [Acholeplasma equirhinis]|uniref:MIP/aquaporin family protein n=1 Tax=Acholeplasma equirhinis TaxID=555393 RepID=UPI00197AFDBF|nr:aquaporin [Acholeplasma equirhinis]MBN3491197.1 aquaporin [Acholeplasma equirhinis]